jgi:kynurenine formamidase
VLHGALNEPFLGCMLPKALQNIEKLKARFFLTLIFSFYGILRYEAFLKAMTAKFIVSNTVRCVCLDSDKLFEVTITLLLLLCHKLLFSHELYRLEVLNFIFFPFSSS